MTLRERSEQAMSALKVFPLPSVVLFPHTLVPLHIFEPRYRDMVRDALATDAIIALAHLKPGWERDYPGRPSLKPICTVGAVVWHEAMQDGRYNIVVQGLFRARLLEELPPSKLYREVRAQLLEDPPEEGPEGDQLRQAVLELATRMPPALAEPLVSVATRFSGGALADAVAAALIVDTPRRERILNQLEVRARTQLVLQEVGELLLRAVPRVGPPN